MRTNVLHVAQQVRDLPHRLSPASLGERLAFLQRPQRRACHQRVHLECVVVHAPGERTAEQQAERASERSRPGHPLRDGAYDRRRQRPHVERRGGGEQRGRVCVQAAEARPEGRRHTQRVLGGRVRRERVRRRVLHQLEWVPKLGEQHGGRSARDRRQRSYHLERKWQVTESRDELLARVLVCLPAARVQQLDRLVRGHDVQRQVGHQAIRRAPAGDHRARVRARREPAPEVGGGDARR